MPLSGVTASSCDFVSGWSCEVFVKMLIVAVGERRVPSADRQRAAGLRAGFIYFFVWRGGGPVLERGSPCLVWLLQHKNSTGPMNKCPLVEKGMGSHHFVTPPTLTK